MDFPLIDTNLLLDFFDNSEKSEKLIKLMQKPCYLNWCIYTELTNLLKNKIGLSKSLKTVELIQKYSEIFKLLAINKQDISLAQEIIHKYQDNGFSWVDCICPAQAKNRKLIFYTKDKILKNYPVAEVKIFL